MQEFADFSLKFEGQMQRRRYWQCGRCQLIQLDRDQLVNAGEEKHRYTTHENCKLDEGYLGYIKPALTYARPYLAWSKPLRALDYGCGEGRPFQELFPPHWQCFHYDPLFFPQGRQEASELDVIVCTEAAEHFHHPGIEWQWMVDHLAPSGVLSIKTGLFDASMDFENWWYIKDITHVCFYSEPTMQWIAKNYGLQLRSCKDNVAVFTKKGL